MASQNAPAPSPSSIRPCESRSRLATLRASTAGGRSGRLVTLAASRMRAGLRGDVAHQRPGVEERRLVRVVLERREVEPDLFAESGQHHGLLRIGVRRRQERPEQQIMAVVAHVGALLSALQRSHWSTTTSVALLCPLDRRTARVSGCATRRATVRRLATRRRLLRLAAASSWRRWAARRSSRRRRQATICSSTSRVGGDDRRPAEELPPRLDDPGVEVLDDPAYRRLGALAVEPVVELGVLLAQHDGWWPEPGDLLALDQSLRPPVGIVRLPQTLDRLARAWKVVERSLAASPAGPGCRPTSPAAWTGTRLRGVCRHRPCRSACRRPSPRRSGAPHRVGCSSVLPLVSSTLTRLRA